jgi:hypothetical protein
MSEKRGAGRGERGLSNAPTYRLPLTAYRYIAFSPRRRNNWSSRSASELPVVRSRSP